MPGASFFKNLGLFVAPGFLDPSSCDQVRAELASAPAQSSTVAGDETDGQGVIDESVRKVVSLDLREPASTQMKKRLLELIPALQDHFQVSLKGCQGPEFLRYDPGAFYLAHHDGREGGPARTASRRVSAVLFLNGQSKHRSEDSYGGGSLVFYGLLDGAQWENVGLPLEGEPGLLIAFRSDVLHEVQQVTFGHRYTAVSWFTS